jgi:peptide/nickel transport system substrate-binding protein
LFKNTGAAYLDKLVFKVIPEQSVRTGSLQSGQLDGIGGVAPQDEDSLKGAGFTLQSRANPGLVFNLQANLARPIVADPAVRTAIRKAINRQQVVDTALSPDFKPATSVLASSTLDYTNLAGELTTDVNGAKQTLDGAGWTVGGDGIRAKDGRRLSLTVVWFSNFGPNQNALELIQQQLKAVGVEITLKEYPIAQALSVQKAGSYDFSWGNLTRADPDILRTTFSTRGGNNSRLTPGALDTALNAQAADGDPARRATDAATAQRLIVENGYSIPVFELTTILGLAKEVHGVAFEASSRLQFYDTWKS